MGRDAGPSAHRARAAAGAPRRGVDWTQQFPELADLPPSAADRSHLLDCELVCFDSTGNPDFARLRARLARGSSQAARAAQLEPSTLIVFDVLHLDGRAVRRLPYSERRRLLAELALDGEQWRTPPAYRAGRDDLAAVTREHSLEGVVARRVSARTWRADAPRARGASSSTAMWKH